ncbi:phosphoenolpyruvate carboxykinase (ATP) [Parapedobacter lycopersici]|uniref:phosphoenolpyruvate carboxykinase (ATP) n=1 Tax=Parapedobacter lycopersici TaxID=1864939 RepID=UPI00214D9552|nr:phosphoenolpyruvate carboxykinase (ATP) [Parapedobacter lycopersici]
MNSLETVMPDLTYLFINENATVHYQKEVAELVETAILNQEGHLTHTGALAADTGYFTGRAPKDRFIVYDDLTKDEIWWGPVNQPISADSAGTLLEQVGAYLGERELYVRDGLAVSDPDHCVSIRAITETAFQNIFVNNLFIRPGTADVNARPDWSILAAPGFRCPNPEQYGLRQSNFVIIDFTRQVILIAGTAYTGEIKKGMFSVLNFILPLRKRILPMHCSANTDTSGSTALFFGLSGTGKTTLSADHDRLLVGDDEHGWDAGGIFNFEGGCYAKCVGLDRTREPEIFDAIRFGALLENTVFYPGSRTPDYENTTKTENTRVAYPIEHIAGSVRSGRAPAPKNIFFLTADAFGVIPPISLLSTTQAMYHFISGYTAKVAGTEVDVKIPQAVFSACFGEAFLPLHPAHYAELLRGRLTGTDIRVWLVNTGWIAGPYGVGRRIKLDYTRAMVRAALAGSLHDAAFRTHPVFKLQYPTACPGVPDAIMDPVSLWANDTAYYAQANRLAALFVENFKKFETAVSADVRAAGPYIP